MSAASVVHATPGRVRVHLADWSGEAPERLHAALRALPGVVDASARPATGNVVVRYDPAVTDAAALLDAVGRVDLSAPAQVPEAETAPALATEDPRLAQMLRAAAGSRRARIAVRGLDRDPRLGRRLIARLQARRDVRRVQVSATTGRALVELADDVVDVEGVLADLTDLELPEEPGEDLPRHPLDVVPLLQSASRTAGASAGLAILGVRALLGREGPPSGAAVGAAAAVGVAEGLPAVQRTVRAALGRDQAEMVLGLAGAVALTASAAPLGLALTAVGGLRVLTEVLARRRAWRAYEERLGDEPAPLPGDTIRLVTGERVPLRGRVVEGDGSTAGSDGLPRRLGPGDDVDAGARVVAGALVVELLAHDPFPPPVRPVPAPLPPVRRYVSLLGVVSLGHAALTLLLTRSPARTLTAVLLVNPRAAMVGGDLADAGASARVLRAGVTIVGTRPERVVHRPDVLVLERPRVASDGFELARVVPLAGESRAPLPALVDAAVRASGGGLGGIMVDGSRYRLESAGALRGHPAHAAMHERGEHGLVLRPEEGDPLALVGLRPRPAPGLDALAGACRRRGTRLVMVEHGDRFAARAVARRAGAELVLEADVRDVVADLQREGSRVGLVADSADASEALAGADLGIGLSSGRSGHFPARADVLAPDLSAVAAIVEAGARRDRAGVAAVAASLAANGVGLADGLRGASGVARASRATYIAALAAAAAGWLLLRGGARAASVATRLADPHPERWGREEADRVLALLDSTPDGLTGEAAAARRGRRRAPAAATHPLVHGVSEQLRSPLAAVLAAGAAISVVMGSTADVPIIAAVIAANAMIGAWQEHQTGRATDELQRLAAPTAQVLRDGAPAVVAAEDVVVGDVLLLSSGDRLVADARVLETDALEVDEAALTGESLPVAKRRDGGRAATRVVLEGSGVTAGTGRAVVVAVGRGTRLGATAAALAENGPPDSPLSRRLARLLRESLPIVLLGGALVAATGLLRGGSLAAQLSLGAGAAIAAVPEGLPLMAGVAEAGVATRLAARGAVVRRPAAVETLGRVDVACFDKTGTLTEGRLAVRRVCAAAPAGGAAPVPGPLPERLRAVLAAAAEASPRPDEHGALAHATDAAVLRSARAAGLAPAGPRVGESPFAASRGFHATAVDGGLAVKGAFEVVLPRCVAIAGSGGPRPLDDAARRQLERTAERLADEGLRVLLVARGRGTEVVDPQGLEAVGFLGLSDPLRAGVADAVDRCHRAGVRLIMLTGDHPATARAIAAEAGLVVNGQPVLSGQEIAGLDEAQLDARLAGVEVVARITPVDKLRIVESLQRQGHTVAMTGDGVNDAPALRLADVGVAMGSGATAVAREAADLVVAGDDLDTMVEALVEGRGFWQNLRRALALLLGGNLGELGLIAGAAALGGRGAMTTRQVLTVNLVTDVLPALAVAVQPPEHRDLAALSREGAAGLDAPLRDDLLRRGAATAAPALAAFATAPRVGADGPTVAFGSVVAAQLAQTLDLGWTEGRLSPSVSAAIGASTAVMAATMTVAPLRAFLGLAVPTPAGLVLMVAASAGAVVVARALAARAADPPARAQLAAV
ncbi:MAG TPA: HAD-IC family P-type ATPase [Baekduia sp.]|nr:HAD-IC family P-type ATPase [Baekduia sp.]